MAECEGIEGHRGRSKYIVRLESVADSGLELGVYLRQDQHSEVDRELAAVV